MTGGSLVRQVEPVGALRVNRTRRIIRWAAFATGAVFVAGFISFHPTRMYVESRADQTKLFLNKLVYEAFPAWQASQGDTSCPTIRDLVRYTDLWHGQVRDAWEQPIEIRCGEPLRGSVHGLWLRSAGADGEFGTADDVMPSPN